MPYHPGSLSTPGADIVNRMLQDVRSGRVPHATALEWLAEIRAENFTNLAERLEAGLANIAAGTAVSFDPSGYCGAFS
ncbi:MAG: hypothetical protein V4472_05390 [Pseudomonadota bacterium]